jgi:hypothetical protein
LTTQITEGTRAAAREAFQQSRAAIQENELDYEVTVNILGLPNAAHTVEADAVRVFSADIDVLAAWLWAKGGTVTKLDTGHGVTVWTLETRAGADEGYVGCQVLVTVALASSEAVMPEIRAAVAA